MVGILYSPDVFDYLPLWNHTLQTDYTYTPYYNGPGAPTTGSKASQAILLGMSDIVREVKVQTGFRSQGLEEGEGFRAQTLQRNGHSSKGGVIQIGYIGEVDEEYKVLTTLVQAGIKVRAFYTPETDLEDVFLRVTKGQVA